MAIAIGNQENTEEENELYELFKQFFMYGILADTVIGVALGLLLGGIFGNTWVTWGLIIVTIVVSGGLIFLSGQKSRLIKRDASVTSEAFISWFFGVNKSP